MKVYERTENGVTTHISIDEGVTELHEATLGRLSRERTTRKITSTRTEHRIEYSDDRTVHLLVVDEPATVESGERGRQIVTVKGKRYVVNETASVRSDAEAFVCYQSGGLLGLPSGPTRTAKVSMKPGTVGRAIWDALNR